MNRNRGDVTFEIRNHIGVICDYPTGWLKELNQVSWNGGPPKYDIREWDPEHRTMSRGTTLHEGELRRLYLMLKEMFEK